MVRRAGAVDPASLTDRFRSPLHDPWLAAWLGLALGVSFTVCFATGLLSHVASNQPGWFAWPTRPAGLYRVTQGLHVATGLATVPLLLVKLWVVYPHLWTWPPVRSAAHLVERVTLVPLVAGAIFLLLTGTTNIARWYPWEFSFVAAHYAAAWITMGGLVTHVAAKLATTREALRRQREPSPEPAPAGDGGLSRRGLLGAAVVGSVAVTVATVGQTFRPLQRVAVLAPRLPNVGPQDVPVNRTARAAGITTAAAGDAWRLVVEGDVDTPLRLSLGDLRRMRLREATLPITCVEGWSSSAPWRGVPIGDLLEAAGAADHATVTVESLQPRGAWRTSYLDRHQARDRDTLLALDLRGEPLHPDHGFPARLIAPNRPGVLQTKWVTRLVVAR